MFCHHSYRNLLRYLIIVIIVWLFISLYILILFEVFNSNIQGSSYLYVHYTCSLYPVWTQGFWFFILKSSALVILQRSVLAWWFHGVLHDADSFVLFWCTELRSKSIFLALHEWWHPTVILKLLLETLAFNLPFKILWDNLFSFGKLWGRLF